MPLSPPRTPRRPALAATIVMLTAGAAAAQTASAGSVGSGVLGSAIARAFSNETTTTARHMQGSSSSNGDWNVGIYPVFVWIPSGIDIYFELPPDSGGNAGSIVDGRFDGAYLGGFYASKSWFRVDADGV